MSVTSALKGLDRIKELIVDTKMPEDGQFLPYEVPNGDLERLSGTDEPLPALPAIDEDASASE